MRFERHHSALIVASMITVASFVGATVYTQKQLARLDELSSTIETNAVPSTEHLSRAAVRLTRLNQLLDDAAVASGATRDAALASARSEVRALESDVRQYLQLVPLDGESEFWSELRADVARAVQLAQAELDEEQNRESGSADDAVLADRVDDALDRAVRAVLATLDFDVHESERIARDVRQVRLTTLRMTILLDAAATAIALCAAIIAYRASRHHDELRDAHATVLGARVAELDRFAGRVAHDVLSPLNTIAMALPLLAQSGDENARAYVDRSQRALQRVQQLVEGLLTFARAGARPDGGSRCDVGPVLASAIADCSDTAAENDISMTTDAEPSLAVACSPGVVTSIVENLVRNAVKYMGASPERRVALRARAAGDVVRLEVEDTGPGIPAAYHASIFEPFVRGPHAGVSGTGLGLATVKRLVESHGGTIAVQSSPGAGSVFRVDLPRAASADVRQSSAAEAHQA